MVGIALAACFTARCGGAIVWSAFNSSVGDGVGTRGIDSDTDDKPRAAMDGVRNSRGSIAGWDASATFDGALDCSERSSGRRGTVSVTVSNADLIGSDCSSRCVAKVIGVGVS